MESGSASRFPSTASLLRAPESTMSARTGRRRRGGTVRVHSAAAWSLLAPTSGARGEEKGLDGESWMSGGSREGDGLVKRSLLEEEKGGGGEGMSLEESLSLEVPGGPRYESLKRSAMREARRLAEQRKTERILRRHAWFMRQATLPGKVVRSRVVPHAEFSARVEELLAGNDMTRRAEALIQEREKALEERKREDHRAWTKQVYDPLQLAIVSAVDSIPGKARSKERNEEYDRFLDASRTRAGLFLSDDVLKRDKGKDYDPLEFTSRTTHRVRAKIRDPLRQFIDRSVSEKTLSAKSPPASSTSKYVDKSREMLGTEWWPDEKIASTPHGYFSFKGHGKHVYPSTKRTMVTTDHFHIENSNDLASKEMGRIGKRVIPGTRPRTHITEHHETEVPCTDDGKDKHIFKDTGILPDVSRSTRGPAVGTKPLQ